MKGVLFYMSLPFKTLSVASNRSYTARIVQGFRNDISNFRTSIDKSKAVDAIHCHDYIQMWYVISGTYRHVFENREFILGKGSLLVVPQFCAHYLDTSLSEDSALYRCEFSDSFINDTSNSEQHTSLFNLVYIEPLLIKADLMEPYHYFTGDAAKEIEAVFEELHQAYYKRDLFSSMFIRANIIKLLALILKEYNEKYSFERNQMFVEYRESIQNALDFIHANYNQKIYLEDVAKIAMMSVRSFSHIFKQITGNTFVDYLLYLRVLKARELLATTDRIQYDICKECGFSDISYFHRTFKRLTGRVPGDYRSLNA
jgi:AraC-like DNA-binding protein/mannose-6-phosphate isomerase-like protein (cupin superfamily)